jgi:hypothetical protein
MTFDEIFQQYAQQGFTKPVMAQGIETIQPIMPLVKPILPMGQQDSGDNNGPTMPTYDPNVGKGFYDYEADAYGVGPTLQGGIAQLIDLYQQLPTPLNLAMRAVGNVSDRVNSFISPTGYRAVTSPGTYSYDDSDIPTTPAVNLNALYDDLGQSGGSDSGGSGGFGEGFSTSSSGVEETF